MSVASRNRFTKILKGQQRNATATMQSADAHIYGDRVEKKAYELYEKRDRRDGRDWDDWFEAEKIVEAEMIGGK